MSVGTLTTFSAFMMKRFLKSNFLYDTIEKTYPWFESIQKRKDFGGSSFDLPVLYDRPQGMGARDRATAQANASTVKGAVQVITTGDYHASLFIANKAIEQSSGNEDAFLSIKEAEMQAILDEALYSVALSSTSNGGNALGQVASVAANVLTLTKKSDVAHFERNMTLVASDNDGDITTDSLLDGGNTTTVVAVDPAAGTVEVNDIADISGLSANDYLFRDGDFFGDEGSTILKGLGAQISGSATPPALYSVTAATRALRPDRLAGCYLASSELTTLDDEERIELLNTRMAGVFRSRVAPRSYLHPEDFNRLSRSLQQRGIIARDDPESRWGHKALSVVAGGKEQKIMSDPCMREGKLHALDPAHWWLASTGDLFHPLGKDGLESLRQATADNYEWRWVCYPALYTNAFIRSGVVTLTSGD